MTRSMKRRWRSTAGLSLAVFCTSTIAFAGPADATTVHSGEIAGYDASPSVGVASASVTFTVPTATCPTTDGTLSGSLGVYFGSFDTYAQIGLNCNGTSPASYTYEFSTPAGSFTEPGAAPGHTVITSIFQTKTTLEAEIHDLTNGAFWVANDNADLGPVSAIFGYFSDLPTIAPFTTTTMSNATVNGDYLGFEKPTHDNLYNGSDLLAKSGALKTGAKGTSFNVAFVSSS